MQRIVNYKNFKKEIVENLHLLTPKQEEYMVLYVKEGLDTPQIAQKCGKATCTVSRTLRRAWHRLRMVIVDHKQVEAVFTFNANGDIIGMKATRTAVRGGRGRLRQKAGML